MKGYIYKIKCLETNEIYIGCSTINFKDRIRTHLNNKSCISRNIINRNNYKITKLLNINCNDINILRLYESIYILIFRKYFKCINTQLSYRTKNMIKYYQKNYYKNNIEKIKKNQKQYTIIYNQKNKNKILRKCSCRLCKKEMMVSNLKRHLNYCRK
jgi:hypothetical protein